MNPDALALITAARESSRAALQAAEAALDLAAQFIESRGEHDDWRRMPSGNNRCLVSGWSRSTLYRLGRAGKLRTKQVNSSTYYAAADVRRLIALAAAS
jgi:hypothetical protein